MSDLPRLAVAREEAEQIIWHASQSVWDKGCSLRLPERPTMPCPVCLGHGRRWRNGQPDGVQCSCSTGIVPIPEGTRVEVGFDELAHTPFTSWRPVATATVAEVLHVIKSIEHKYDDVWAVTNADYVVTLTDVEATDG